MSQAVEYCMSRLSSAESSNLEDWSNIIFLVYFSFIDIAHGAQLVRNCLNYHLYTTVFLDR